MILIAVVDDNYGMMFNKRRQSQDRILRERILELIIPGRCLWMNSYTKKQFTETIDRVQICVDDNFLEKAPSGDFCFVENESISFYEDKIEKIVLFHWNRKYPADFYFDISLDNKWKFIMSEEFTGYSHEKITMEVYEK